MIVLSAFVAITIVVIGIYLWWRLASWDAPVLVACCGIGAWAAAISLMGLPKPATHALLANWDDVEIISYQLDEGNAIYLWIRRDEPVAYRLPWNTKQARELHKAAEKAKEKHTNLRMAMRAETEEASAEWMFYPEPVRPLPPKDKDKEQAAAQLSGSAR